VVQAQPPPEREAVDERFREFEAGGTKGVPMKAIVQEKYGGADVLHLEDIDTPTVGSGEVLLSVQAASLFAGDWHYMAGMPLAFRPASGVTKPRIRVRGRDVAGRVETVGPDVSTFHEGDAVYGICNGAFAEFATATVKKLAPKPANLTFEEAATVPITGTTALQAVRDHGKVQAGQSVLIIGAAGGVGSFAVQIAKAFGAVVTGVCNTSQIDAVLSMGADAVIDYTREDFTASGTRYDVILDTAGNRKLSVLRRGLAPRGTLVIVGGEGGKGRFLGGFTRGTVEAPMVSLLTSQKMKGFVAKENARDLVALKDLIEAGKVSPLIDRTFSLGDVPEAMRYLLEGRGRKGKIVIAI
jgi:NADPH:quinone reductase-like Zn-dependent oxidoreductase